MIKKFILITSISLLLTGCTQNFERTIKSIKSNYNGGLNRTVTVYSNTGGILAQYSGKFDIDDDDSSVMFDIDDKRIVIYNAIVIAEEE